MVYVGVRAAHGPVAPVARIDLRHQLSVSASRRRYRVATELHLTLNL